MGTTNRITLKKFRKYFKKALIKILEPVNHRLGFTRMNPNATSHGDNKNELLEIVFNNFKSIGFNPKHIVDIGANHGTWTREVLTHFPDAYYTLLEPQAWLQDSLQDLLDQNEKIQFHAVGAGATEGSFQFTIVNRDDSCSFRYTQKEAAGLGYKQIEIPVVTLNSLLSKMTLPTPDIIKIDAEGLDIEVLQGASDFFGKTEVFMVEAAVGNKEFDNSLYKIIHFMDENGYRLFDLTDLNRPFEPKILWLVELVFVKKEGIIDTRKIDFNF